jgi:hypothetical protein
MVSNDQIAKLNLFCKVEFHVLMEVDGARIV